MARKAWSRSPMPAESQSFSSPARHVSSQCPPLPSATTTSTPCCSSTRLPPSCRCWRSAAARRKYLVTGLQFEIGGKMAGVTRRAVLYAEDDPNDVLFMRYAWLKAGVPNPLKVVHDGGEV